MRKRSKPIYTVMAVKWDFEYIKNYDNKEWLIANPTRRIVIRDRLWGFFRDLRTAKRSVRQNCGDNFDEAGYYNGAIVEEINEGYFRYSRKRRWFFKHKNLRARHVTLVDMKEPKYYRNIVGLTMG